MDEPNNPLDINIKEFEIAKIVELFQMYGVKI